MKLKDRLINISRWDYYSLSIVLLVTVIQILRWRTLPIFIDIYYHLLTAQGFKEAGGWVHSCFWEFAPIGRPQLYPPLLHILLSLLLKLGIPFMIIGKLVQCAIYPVMLFVIWYVIREVFDRRQAFFTILLMFGSYTFYLTAINTSAASLSLIFCFLSLLFLERRRVVVSSLFLATSFYTHGYTSWIFLIAFILYGLLNKTKIAYIIKTVLITLCLASPFIAFQWMHRGYFIFQNNIVENYYIELDLFNWVLFLFGLIACIKNRSRYSLLIAVFISTMLLLWSGNIFRYLSFYGIISVILMNSVVLRQLCDSSDKSRRLIYLSVIILVCFILSPTINIDLSQKKMSRVSKEFLSDAQGTNIDKKNIASLDFFDSNLANFAFYCSKPNIRNNETSIYFSDLFKDVKDAIIANSSMDDIVYYNVPVLGGIISLLSQRVSSSAMLSEVGPYYDFDKVYVSKLVVWYKDPDELDKEPYYLIDKYNLSKISDTKVAFVYENQDCHFKKQKLSATISYRMLFVVILLASFAVWLSMKFDVDK
jgi:hypothetical protein